jgi:CubicO group peptidase (beta-lactamase class C family)
MKIFTVALVLSFFTMAWPQEPVSPTKTLTDAEVISQVRSLVDQAAADDSFSGAVLLAKDGKPIFERAVGFANKETKASNNTDTRFNLGSIDKSFTSIAIAQLAQQGKLRFTDTVAKYLPDYPNKAVAEKVTIHQLLTHTSGLGDYLGSESLGQLKSLREILPLFANAPLLFEAGTKLQYSNAGYVVLGLVIEKISGISYYEYVSSHIFKPAGMDRTGSFERDQKLPDLAVGYTRMGPDGPQTGPRRPNTSTLAGKGSSAGGGYSTVEDLLRFANALSSNKLLSPEYAEIVFTGGGPQKAPGPGRGYGFMQGVMNGVRVIGNGGGGPGVNAMFRTYVGRGYTVVVLSNYDPPAAQHIAAKIDELLMANWGDR